MNREHAKKSECLSLLAWLFKKILEATVQSQQSSAETIWPLESFS
jgi:hypothetical protein